MMSSTIRQPGSYISRNVFELRDSVDATKLKKAWAVIVEENPIFRTRIVDIPNLDLVQAVIAVPFAEERPLYNPISSTAHQQPNSLAINAWDGQMTYSELDRTLSEWASRLVALWARPTVTIPLHFEKSLWMPVAILAVLKPGSSFLQLSTAVSAERMKAILNAIQPLFALSYSKRYYGLPSHITTNVVPKILEDIGSPEHFWQQHIAPMPSRMSFSQGIRRHWNSEGHKMEPPRPVYKHQRCRESHLDFKEKLSLHSVLR
ncbi:hypothetical protein PMG11_05014 [Penicillium brasilianum]|uniref:AMP-dependent synthetase/ligase domain-containing protein n=1 Tax=Penicillium brasilianum TaxID=104259 RepID=A0A0F7VIS6_PENBI|nr:hypothetical protein PMG11_05014 [Penicillium brasilianum]